MIKEEYELLKMKHLKSGLTSREAHTKIEKLKEFLDQTRIRMKAKGKSESEIKSKLQQKFEEEFQKLCCD